MLRAGQHHRRRSRVHQLQPQRGFFHRVGAVGDQHMAVWTGSDSSSNCAAVVVGQIQRYMGYVIEELCIELGLSVVKKNIEPYDVYTADEAFMTGTPFCMLPVTALNSNPIGTGEVGSVFSGLLNQWGKNTGVDIAAQIGSWDLARAESTGSSQAPTPYQFKSK